MSKARDLADLLDANGDVELDALDNAPSGSGKNLIINGAMQVAQRGTSSSGQTSAGYKDVDRFFWDITTIGTHTTSQSTDAPDGFSNSAKIEVTTADASPTGSDRLALQYKAEAQDLQGLAYGTSSAKSLTLSFWVKSNKTGTYSNEIMQQDNSNKHWSFDYTISSADTWEYKTITFTGDTSGVINNDNGSGLQIKFWLGAGPDYTSGTYSTGQWQTRTAANAVSSSSPNVADTIGNTWQITGVQLEVGSVATPFEHRSYGEELALCQRYFHREYYPNSSPRKRLGNGVWGTSTNTRILFNLPVTMRATPTLSAPSKSNLLLENVAWYVITSVSAGDSTPNRVDINALVSSSGASNGDVATIGNGGGTELDYQFDAEL